MKFASEEAPGTKVTAKTVKEAIAALKKARKEVQGLEKDERYRGFKLVLTDDAKRARGATGRSMRWRTRRRWFPGARTPRIS